MSTNQVSHHRILPSVKAVITRGNKFLAVTQTNSGELFWDLPGGKIEYGEDPYDGLRREVKEETSLDVTIGEALGTWWFLLPTNPDDMVVCFTFRCYGSGEVDITHDTSDTGGIDRYQWLSKEEFLTDVYRVPHPSFKEFIRDLPFI